MFHFWNSWTNEPRSNFCFSQIDIFVGALDENLLTHKYFIASRAYYHDSLTWCVQKRKPIAMWKRALYLCTDVKVYVLTPLSVVLFQIPLYVFQQLESPKRCSTDLLLNALCICLGFPCTLRPKSNPCRILIISCLFASIIIVVVTASVSIRSITTPMLNPQIDSIKQITNGEFSLVGDRFAFLKMLHQNEVNGSIHIINS